MTNSQPEMILICSIDCIRVTHHGLSIYNPPHTQSGVCLQVHALILGHLRHEMPSMWGKEKKQNELIENIVAEFRKVVGCLDLVDG